MSDSNFILTDNIWINEVICKCGCGMGYIPTEQDEQVISRVYFLAQNVQPLINFFKINYKFPEYTRIYAQFNSWCRCPVHNKKEGGARKSTHLTGGATDLVLYVKKKTGGRIYIDPKDICRAAFLLNKTKTTTFNGIGCYRNRVHLDVRDEGVVTWYKKDTGTFQNGEKYLYGVDFNESKNLAIS